ncbi:MAG TPA: hypothetical protein V6D00_01570 [Pantanalinema sp.]
MAWRHRGILAALALTLGLLGAGGADARVGDTVENFEAGPMVTGGQVAFLEPFTLKNKALSGVTYRATSTYKKACQVMLVVKGGKIESEIFAIPVVGDPEVLKAERELLDSFLVQSGIPAKYHAAIREHMVAAMDNTPAPRKMGTHMVQALMIPAEVPLLVIAVAKDSATLPFPKPAIQPQAEQ